MTTPQNSATTLLITTVDNALRTLFAKPVASRLYPLAADPGLGLSPREKALSGALMRVNHTGEICAQALYSAQALTARNPALRQEFNAARKEEGDHLAWTKQRLDALDSRPSLLNPLWYVASFGLGLLAGTIGDKASLGFVVETERQVEAHLASHMQRLPVHDYQSKAIVGQMQKDEARHALEAQAAGATELPIVLKVTMRATAKVMTTVAHWV